MADQEMDLDPNTTLEPAKDDDDAPIVVSLVRKEVQVKVVDAAGSTRDYILREMTGAQRDAWMNKTQGKMSKNAEGKSVGIRDFTGLHASLISACLYQAEDNKPVSEQVIQTFPSSVQTTLFARAQKMNGLEPDSEKKEKKD